MRVTLLVTSLLAAVAARQMWAQATRLRRAAELARAARGIASSPLPSVSGAPCLRVLVLGDSTAAGVGAGSRDESPAGRIAGDCPRAEVVDAGVSGSRLRDVLARCRASRWRSRRFDVVLLMVGGNDVLRGTDWRELRDDALALVRELRRIAPSVVWLGAANFGLAPALVAPFSWWVSGRARYADRLFAACAKAGGAQFVSFFRERRDDPFSRDPQRYYAPDRLHPSSAAYGHCHAVAKRETALGRLLDAAGRVA